MTIYRIEMKDSDDTGLFCGIIGAPLAPAQQKALDAILLPEHTPGPWAYEQRAEMGDAQWVVYDPDSDNGDILAVVDADPEQSAEANARLIAAAPDLLAVVATMLGAAEADALDDKSNVWRSAMLDARAALAKVQS
jgi:hypothetical protein